MKTLVTFLILFFSFTPTLFSQNFGMLGTEWHYSGNAGGGCLPGSPSPSGNCEYFHFKSVLDTIIQGKTAHKITRTYYRQGGDIVFRAPIYVYNQVDTTFAYSFSQSRFLKLFIFNGNQGDTLTLDQPPEYSAPANSTYRLVIDTVINRSIDGIPLKEYRTTNLDGIQFYSQFGSFMDRIGGLDWLIPRPVVIPEFDEPIRCYHDAQIDTNFQSIACDFILITSISEVLDNSNIKLYPNPSSNHLIIENLGQQKSNVIIEIRSITGKLVLIQKAITFEKVVVNTSQIPAGIYFVTVKGETKTITTQKWVKME